MSTIKTIKEFIEDPTGTYRRISSVANEIATPEWRKANPISTGVLAAGLPVSAASGLTSLAAGLTDNEQLDNAAHIFNWYLDPVVDTAGEFITNKHLFGMSNKRAAGVAGGSLAGTLGGQYIAESLFKDEQGNPNPVATFVGGYIGDAVGDSIADKAIDLATNYLRNKRR